MDLFDKHGHHHDEIKSLLQILITNEIGSGWAGEDFGNDYTEKVVPEFEDKPKVYLFK